MVTKTFFTLTREQFPLHNGANITLPACSISQQPIAKHGRSSISVEKFRKMYKSKNLKQLSVAKPKICLMVRITDRHETYFHFSIRTKSWKIRFRSLLGYLTSDLDDSECVRCAPAPLIPSTTPHTESVKEFKTKNRLRFFLILAYGHYEAENGTFDRGFDRHADMTRTWNFYQTCSVTSRSVCRWPEVDRTSGFSAMTSPKKIFLCPKIPVPEIFPGSPSPRRIPLEG